MRLTDALVAKLPTSAPDPGFSNEFAHLVTDEARLEARDDLLARHPEGASAPIWVFAIGSLIWKPEVPVIERRKARLDGWQRAFALGPDTRHRGNPDAPAIMLTMDRGGSCEGIALRLDPETAREDLLTILHREPPIPALWLPMTTPDGPVTAAAFVCDPGGLGYVGDLSLQETARMNARAVGILGPMAGYVLNTTRQLEAAGIHDPVVWQMQELIAQELEQL